jgi:transcriptional regulator of acetoin/glycerol metabolism
MDDGGAVGLPGIQAAAPLLPGEPRQLYASLRRAWEKFVSEGRLGARDPVRTFVLERWRWCKESSLDPHANKAPHGLDSREIAELLRRDDFAIAGSRVLSDFAHVVEDRGHVIVLADALGRIFYEVGDRSVMRALEPVNFCPGGLWCETAVGPNGVGTPLSTGTEGFIFGPEHFCEGWQAWVCYGSPVRDPLSGRIVGAVDVSGSASTLERSVLNFTTSLARSIERILMAVSLEKRQALVEEYLGAVRRWPNQGVIATDETGHIVHFSSDASTLCGERRLCAGEPVTNALPEAEVFLQVDARRAEVPAQEDERICGSFRVHYIPLALQGRPIGSLFVIRPVDARAGFAKAPSSHPVAASPASSPGLCTFDDVHGSSAAIREAIRMANLAANSDKNVLLSGETGTGKELFAQAIHAASRRAGGPFVAVNCAAIPSELVESELFGYAPGAFTGARRDGARGRFEQANGGTIFLDEISSMPLGLQGKLLRVVESRTLTKLGGWGSVPLDVRIIAASNEDLKTLVDQGRMRRDLYYRLNVLSVHCPSLRERGDDVILLADLFLRRECGLVGRPALALTPEVERLMRAYRWPGNVRELKNLCARWAEVCPGSAVIVEDLPPEMRSEPALENAREHRKLSLREMEYNLVLQTLRECGNNVSEAARRLGVSRTTLYQKLRNSRKAGNQL